MKKYPYYIGMVSLNEMYHVIKATNGRFVKEIIYAKRNPPHKRRTGRETL